MTAFSQNAHSPCGIGRRRLDALLNHFAGRKVLVVGDLMLDEYIWGQTSRVSPEAPVLVLDVQRTTHSLGGAANVARNIHALGASVTLAGVVGADPSAHLLLDDLESDGCSTAGVVTTDDRPTTVKTRVVVQNQQIVRIDRETRKPVCGAALDKMLAIIEKTIPEVDAVVLSDYAKGVLTDRLVTTAVTKAKEYGVPLAANLKPPQVEAFRGATLLTLNLAEAERAWQRPIVDEKSLFRCGQALRKRLACKGLLITRGGDGVAVFASAREPLVIPAQRVEVYDVTGAGDTVISAATMALSGGATCGEAAAIGNLAGNIKVTKLGTATVVCDEIRQFAAQHFSESSFDDSADDDGTQLRIAA
jgi:D-beta-D-heptose 7-phosphate kinase/D-beta-D-heptose 1-phosphate adenosyltransferase